jgi:hypothetical protein
VQLGSDGRGHAKSGALVGPLMQQRRRITLDIYLLWIIVVVRMPFLFKRKSNGRDSILKSVTSFTFPCYLNILQRLITSCHEWAVDSVTAKWYNVMLYFHFLSIPFFSFLDTNDIFTDCKTEGVKVVVDIRCDVISCIITSISSRVMKCNMVPLAQSFPNTLIFSMIFSL